MTHLMTPILAAWLVITLAAVLVWDVMLPALGFRELSVSHQLYQWGQQHPVLYLLIGVAIGHILFPLVVRNGGTQP